MSVSNDSTGIDNGRAFANDPILQERGESFMIRHECAREKASNSADALLENVLANVPVKWRWKSIPYGGNSQTRYQQRLQTHLLGRGGLGCSR
jgi:hypothetical protein